MIEEERLYEEIYQRLLADQRTEPEDQRFGAFARHRSALERERDQKDREGTRARPEMFMTLNAIQTLLLVEPERAFEIIRIAGDFAEKRLGPNGLVEVEETTDSYNYAPTSERVIRFTSYRHTIAAALVLFVLGRRYDLTEHILRYLFWPWGSKRRRRLADHEHGFWVYKEFSDRIDTTVHLYIELFPALHDRRHPLLTDIPSEFASLAKVGKLLTLNEFDRDENYRLSVRVAFLLKFASSVDSSFLGSYWTLRENVLRSYSENTYLTTYDMCCLVTMLKDKSQGRKIRMLNIWKRYGGLVKHRLGSANLWSWWGIW